jgi:uncharacterized membrane protein YdbT with pleckstrin-like domain
MRYIERIRQPGENLLYRSKIHWIVYVPGVLLWIVAIVVFFIGIESPAKEIGLLAALLLALIAAASTLHAWFRRWTTEIDVTDRRIVYKRGFIRRHTVEMNMDKVESVDVDQTVLGRLLGYGTIKVRGTGGGLEPLPKVEAPLDFRNHVTAR